MIPYRQDKGHYVEIKTAITGDDFELVTMIFVADVYFPSLGGRTNSQWCYLLQQHQRTVDGLIGGLRVSVGNQKSEKGYLYHIWLLWTYGRTSILSSENVGDTRINKIYCEHVDIEKLNSFQSKKVMEVYQNTLGYITDHKIIE